MSDLTLLGLGAMGTAIGHAFLKASIKLTTWNRTANRPAVKTLVDAGATFEPDLVAALEASPTIVICVTSYDIVDNLLSQVQAADAMNVLKGKTIINLTNGTPKEAREISKQLHTDSAIASYFDGGIMAVPEAIGTEASFVFVSGESGESDFEDSTAKDIIGKIGQPHYLASDPGAAALYDLALLAGMYGLFAGSFVAMGLMRKGPLGTKIEPLVQNFLSPLLQYMAGDIKRIAKAWDNSDWSSHGHPTEMQRVAIDNVLKTCREEGVDSGFLDYWGAMVGQLIEKHGGEGGIAQLGEMILQ